MTAPPEDASEVTSGLRSLAVTDPPAASAGESRPPPAPSPLGEEEEEDWGVPWSEEEESRLEIRFF